MSFRAEADDLQLQSLVEGDEATAVAYLEAVKLQFDLADLVLVRGEQSCAMQSRMPRRVYRFQRRQAYRVRTLERGTPVAVLRHPAMPDMSMQLRVLDVSLGGCALLLPDDVPPIMAGSTLRGVQVALDADTRFQTTLVLHHITSIRPQAKGVRLGCELTGLSGESTRALQRYIDQTQKRRRLLSLS
jgi:c-di-GMP-binding flagellar brake protein YcgR